MDTTVFKKKNTLPKSVFSKQKEGKNLLSKGCLDLHSALKNTYQTKDKQEKYGKDCGYEYDKELSNDNQQVYYNKDKGHLMFSVAGTHNINDIGTDLKLMAKGVKSTDRYKEAEMTLKKAKQKYNPKMTTGIGHSLGGRIISDLDGIDKKATMNKASTNPFVPTRANEVHVRTYGDVVSFLSRGNKHTHNVIGGNIKDPYTWLRAHNTDNIKKYGYKVPDS